jgi:hypothetical protein
MEAANMTPYRITIRNVDPNMADLFREIAQVNDMTLGDAFDEAVTAWEGNLLSEESDN